MGNVRLSSLIEKVLIINPEECTNCRICELACSFVKTREFNPAVSRVKILKAEAEGVHCPMVCMNCEEPPCQVVCPVEAIVRDPKTGGVVIREDVCIGCRACTIVCPYGAISMDPRRRIAVKCDLCQGDPECAKMCPTDAILHLRADMADLSQKRPMMEKITEGITLSRRAVSKVG